MLYNHAQAQQAQEIIALVIYCINLHTQVERNLVHRAQIDFLQLSRYRIVESNLACEADLF